MTKAENGPRTLLDLIEALPGRGDRLAVLAFGEAGAEHWTCAGLADLVGQLARGLAGAGVGRGDHVALLAGNGVGWIPGCLAVLKAGAVVVPLDVQLDDGTLLRILDDSAVKLVFTTAEGADRLGRLNAAPEPVLLDAGEEDARSWRRLLASPARHLPRVGPEDPAALFYTSGTTGAPRGVPLSHANLAFQVRTLLKADLVTEEDRFLLPLPLHHVYPFVVGMLAPLAAGLPIVAPRSLAGPDIARALREGLVTWIVGVPRLYGALYSGVAGRARSSGPLGAALFGVGTWLGRRLGPGPSKVLLRPVRRRVGPRLRGLTCGGAALDPGLARRLEAFGWRVVAGYGLTETSPLLTLNPPDGQKLESVGRPLPGVEVRVDPYPGASPGEGELLVRGPGVFSGYRNMPEETARAFDGGWLRTGDLGRLDEDGYLYVTGRASTLIVTGGGKNVQPEEVEDAYLESPVIAEIGVLQKDGRLVALILPDLDELRRLGKKDVDRAIRDAIGESSRRLPPHRRLSDYAMTREPLEYTRLGKLRRHLLEGRYDRAKRGEGRGEGASPLPAEAMSAQDRALLLENPAAQRVWDWLARRYPAYGLTPDTSPQLDLGFDSMEWINLSLGVGEDAGARLDEAAIGRIATVRDLLREVAEGPGTDTLQPSPLESPEQILSDEQRRWLAPLSPGASVAAHALFALNRAVMRGFFGLRVEGVENLPGKGPFVLAANHPSYLDAFAVAAALDHRSLRRTYWGSWMGLAFQSPVARLLSRLARLLPVADVRVGASSLALAAAVLKRGQALIWFPEGYRSYTGELQRFKPGIGVLLDHFRVPVVPAFVRGSYEALPRGKVLPRPKRITVVFGRPLNVGELERRGEGESPRDRIVGALRESVAGLDGRP